MYFVFEMPVVVNNLHDFLQRILTMWEKSISFVILSNWSFALGFGDIMYVTIFAWNKTYAYLRSGRGVYIYIYIYICVCVCVRVCVFVCVCLYIYIYIYECIHLFQCVCLSEWVVFRSEWHFTSTLHFNVLS